VHGTAHWASRAEIEATGLLPRRGRPGAGVYVGGWTDQHGQLHYLRHDGPEHIAAIAPTRSGKGVGLVIPTLLSWPHSVVVNDMKAELWNSTAAWREQHGGNLVMRFDPGSPEGSVRFNPLDEIRLGTIHEAGDVQNLATILVDPEGKGLVDHWAKTSHAFLTGAVLHVLYKAKAAGRPGTLPDVSRALSDPAQPVEALYKEMLANKWGPGGTLHDIVATSARDMTNRPEDERGSVLSTAMSFLSLYRDPLVAKNVSASDFSIADLMNHEKPVTLYLIVRAEDKDRMKPLMRLILNQLVRVLLRPEIKSVNGRPVMPHKHRLLLMLDEFPSYGRLEVFQEALAYIAGYGIKAYLIMQDIAQLWGAYGHDESIMSNCHVRVAYAPNKIETAEWLSRMAGTMTVVKEDITTTGNRFSAVLQNVSRTFHEVSRPLATADEIMRLKSPVKDGQDMIAEPGSMLIFAAGHAPIYGTQSLYFRDPVFSARVKLPVPAGSPGIAGSRPARPPFKL
jgi:type IV secretion system protein VirD4